MSSPLEKYILDKVQAELNELDHELVEIDGHPMKPSQCYHFSTDPAHVLFNTNCPDSLKERVQAILHKYIPADEGSASE